MVLRHALDPQAFLPQTLKYQDTGAWVSFNTKNVAGTVLFRFIDVVPVLSPNPTLTINPNIDYEALAKILSLSVNTTWLIRSSRTIKL